MSSFTMLVLFLLFVCSVRGYARDQKCDPTDQLQCDDGSCILKLQWCDSAVDCTDRSDEMFCNGEFSCHKDIHFECENKKCIPVAAVCDQYDDCHDGSDEKNCTSLFDSLWLNDGFSFVDSIISLNSSTQSGSSVAPRHPSGIHETAVDKAVKYLLSKRNSDNGWGAFTPRAVIALSMASRISPIAEENKQLVQKQLNIHILQDLMKNRNTTLSNLALYINALYATCQDPRNFQGLDLVGRLRLEADIAAKSNTSIPLAFLTLCLSDATRFEDNYKLANLYNSRDHEMRTGYKALIVLAMTCITHKDQTGIFGNYMDRFFSVEFEKTLIADIYTQTLFKQASTAAGFSYPVELASKQLPDGSFGDMLSTYYAIPAMMNSSLLDLVCSSQNDKSIMENDMDRTEGTNEVTYSLWITNGKDPISHSITVGFYGRKTVFDIMMIAASRDPLYRFLYDDSEQEGKSVYSLAGTPNDIESGTSWFLYSAKTDNVKVNSVHGLILLDEGVDKYFADDKDHFIFWFRRNLPAH